MSAGQNSSSCRTPCVVTTCAAAGPVECALRGIAAILFNSLSWQPLLGRFFLEGTLLSVLSGQGKKQPIIQNLQSKSWWIGDHQHFSLTHNYGVKDDSYLSRALDIQLQRIWYNLYTYLVSYLHSLSGLGSNSVLQICVIFNVYVSVTLCIYVMCMQVPPELRKRRWVPWSWIHRHLSAAWC